MIDREKKIIFIHIPKTGGTTIEKLLFPTYKFEDKTNYSYLYGWDCNLGWLNHLTLDQILNFDDNNSFQKYQMFAVVRNPWDRLASEYHWKISISKLTLSFSDFVRALYINEAEKIKSCYKSELAYLQHFKLQSDYLSASYVDVIKILRFENFEKDVRRFLHKNGIMCNNIPRIRASHHSHYTEYYDNDCIEMVREIYGEDIDRFGYCFE